MLRVVRSAAGKLRDFVDGWMRWSDLRTVGNSPLVRFTVFMPVVGYLLLLNEALTGYVEIDPRFRTFAWEAPVRLLMLYWGFFFVGAGSAAYAAFCPHAIKRHETPAEYAAAMDGYLAADANREHYTEMLVDAAKSPRARAVLRSSPAWRLVPKLASPILPTELDASRTTLAAAGWLVSNVSRPFWRVFAAVCFGVGFPLLAFPAVVTLWGVLRYSARVVLSASH